jgi:hypothetical protein
MEQITIFQLRDLIINKFKEYNYIQNNITI